MVCRGFFNLFTIYNCFYYTICIISLCTLNRNCILIRDSFDCSTNEKDRLTFVGKLLEKKDDSKFVFAFKVEEQIMRMEIIFNENLCEIHQKYPDSSAKIVLNLINDGYYRLELANGYSLTFITKTSFIKYDDFNIELKYNLFDGNSNQIISVNEIKIMGDDKIC